MKHLGKIKSGGSLDITTNQHVENLVEEALESIELPEGADTTYTLTQDGLTIQLVDDSGGVVSTIELPNIEDTDTTYTLSQDGLVVQLVDDGGNTVSEIKLPDLEDTDTTYTLSQDGTTIQLVDDGGGVVSTINLPEHEDTDTTYTLTQDGTIIKLVDGEGGTASEVDLAPLLPEDEGGGDPYQEEKDFVIPPAKLFNLIRSEDYDDFDITSEFDEGAGRISIYLHLYRRGIVRNFTLVSRARNSYTYYDESGSSLGRLNLIDVYKDGEYVRMVGADGTQSLRLAQIKLTEDSPINRIGGVVLFTEWGSPVYFHISGSNDRTESEPTVITGTLEDHIQRMYESIHQ